MRRILIVDDEPDIIEAFGRLFENDYEIKRACNGEDAIRIIGEDYPELIVLDWRLKSEIEGKDVLMFSKREYPKIPVYVVTASIQSVKQIKSLGADRCLLKPCADLKQKINAALPP